MHYCRTTLKCSGRLFTPSHPTPPHPFFRARKLNCNLSDWLLHLTVLFLFPGDAEVFEISVLPDDHEFMLLSSSSGFYSGKRKWSPNSEYENSAILSPKQNLGVQILTLNLLEGFAIPWPSRANLLRGLRVCLGRAPSIGLPSCLGTFNILIHHLNQYGAVLLPRKEPWTGMATWTKLI